MEKFQIRGFIQTIYIGQTKKYFKYYICSSTFTFLNYSADFFHCFLEFQNLFLIMGYSEKR